MRDWTLIELLIVAAILFILASVAIPSYIDKQRRDELGLPAYVGEFRLLVDPGTGCHYLRSTSGAPTPRLDGSGRQVGCK